MAYLALNVKSFNRHRLTVLLPGVFQPAGKSILSSSPLRKLFFSLSRENPFISYRILQQRRMFRSKVKRARGSTTKRWRRGKSPKKKKENNVIGSSYWRA